MRFVSLGFSGEGKLFQVVSHALRGEKKTRIVLIVRISLGNVKGALRVSV